MVDRDKVIKGLENCTDIFMKCKDGCPYFHETELPECMQLKKDALVLLKEQEAVEPFHKCIGNEFSLIEDSHFDYCPYCGKPITWTKQEGR